MLIVIANLRTLHGQKWTRSRRKCYSHWKWKSRTANRICRTANRICRTYTPAVRRLTTFSNAQIRRRQCNIFYRPTKWTTHNARMQIDPFFLRKRITPPTTAVFTFHFVTHGIRVLYRPCVFHLWQQYSKRWLQ